MPIEEKDNNATGNSIVTAEFTEPYEFIEELSGSYNLVKGTVKFSNRPHSDKGIWMIRKSVSHKTDVPESDPDLCFRLSQEINPDILAGRLKDPDTGEETVIMAFIDGRQSTDEEMAKEVLDIYRRSGRIVADLDVKGNCLTTASGEIYCVAFDQVITPKEPPDSHRRNSVGADSVYEVLAENRKNSSHWEKRKKQNPLTANIIYALLNFNDTENCPFISLVEYWIKGCDLIDDGLDILIYIFGRLWKQSLLVQSPTTQTFPGITEYSDQKDDPPSFNISKSQLYFYKLLLAMTPFLSQREFESQKLLGKRLSNLYRILAREEQLCENIFLHVERSSILYALSILSHKSDAKLADYQKLVDNENERLTLCATYERQMAGDDQVVAEFIDSEEKNKEKTGSYNTVTIVEGTVKFSKRSSQESTDKTGKWVIRRPLRPKDITPESDPDRCLRLLQDLNPTILAGRWHDSKDLNNNGVVVQFIDGRQSTDKEMTWITLDIYKRTGRIVADLCVQGNCLTTSSGQIYCVDVDQAITPKQLSNKKRRNSWASEKVLTNAEMRYMSWMTNKEIYPLTANILYALLNEDTKNQKYYIYQAIRSFVHAWATHHFPIDTTFRILAYYIGLLDEKSKTKISNVFSYYFYQLLLEMEMNRFFTSTYENQKLYDTRLSNLHRLLGSEEKLCEQVLLHPKKSSILCAFSVLCQESTATLASYKAVINDENKRDTLCAIHGFHAMAYDQTEIKQNTTKTRMINFCRQATQSCVKQYNKEEKNETSVVPPTDNTPLKSKARGISRERTKLAQEIRGHINTTLHVHDHWKLRLAFDIACILSGAFVIVFPVLWALSGKCCLSNQPTSEEITASIIVSTVQNDSVARALKFVR